MGEWDRHKYPIETMYKIGNLRTYCIAQGTLLGALWRPKWEGNPRGDLRIHTADLLCCVEINRAVQATMCVLCVC